MARSRQRTQPLLPVALIFAAPLAGCEGDTGRYEDLALAVFNSETFAAADWNSRHRDRFRTIDGGVRFADKDGKVDANLSLRWSAANRSR